MLRFSLLALLLANAGYFAWTQGWMASLGWQPETQSEPQRLKQQIRPETIKVGPQAAAALPAASSTPAPASGASPASVALTTPGTPPVARCWQVGTFDERQAASVRNALLEQDIGTHLWEMQTTSTSSRWMVYLGQFNSTDELNIRRDELRQKGVDFDRPGGALELGLSLGRFSTEEAATRELTSILRQGVRGARVVQERAESTLYTLRLPSVTPEVFTRLERAKPALAGKPLRLCDS